MPRVVHKRKKTKGTLIGDRNAGPELNPVQKSPAPPNPLQGILCERLANGRWLVAEEKTAAIRDTKQEAEDAVRRKVRHKTSPDDFYASMSAAELARSQGVQPIRKLGQIPTFSDPDPKEADWFAREVRRRRREGQPRAGRR